MRRGPAHAGRLLCAVGRSLHLRFHSSPSLASCRRCSCRCCPSARSHGWKLIPTVGQLYFINDVFAGCRSTGFRCCSPAASRSALASWRRRCLRLYDQERIFAGGDAGPLKQMTWFQRRFSPRPRGSTSSPATSSPLCRRSRFIRSAWRICSFAIRRRRWPSTRMPTQR